MSDDERDDPVAEDRDPEDYCERGTQGCCVAHSGSTPCREW